MHILTFDIEEWFHLLEHPNVRDEADWGAMEARLPRMLDRILGMLDDTGRPATFFCLGWVGRRYPELVRRIVGCGHEIGSHSDVHSLIHEQTRGQFEAELRKSLGVLEDLSGERVRAFRAPGFSLVPKCAWAFEVLIAAGLEIDCSVFPAVRAHGGFRNFPAAGPVWIETPSGRIKEFPMNVARLLGRPLVFSGGGYFRLIPLPVLQHLWLKSPYTMTYFHPRDFEPKAPQLPGLGPVRRFKSYYGLAGAEAKLRAILAAFEFVSLAEADSRIDWGKVETVQIR